MRRRNRTTKKRSGMLIFPGQPLFKPEARLDSCFRRNDNRMAEIEAIANFCNQTNQRPVFRMDNLILQRKWYLVLFLLLAILWWSMPAVLMAHGGGDIQVNNEAVGPFVVSVWMNPPTALTNQPIHITVGLAEPTTQAPILNATVQLDILATDTQTPILTTSATTDQSVNKLFYETDFTLADSGTYTVVVAVASEAGAGEVAFDMVVRPASNRWYGWLAVAAVGLVALWAVWQGWQARKTAVSPSPPRRPNRPA